MEIIVDVHRGESGRPAGTVRAPGETAGRPFSGNLELLALVEALYLTETPIGPSDSLDAESADDHDDRSER